MTNTTDTTPSANDTMTQQVVTTKQRKPFALIATAGVAAGVIAIGAIVSLSARVGDQVLTGKSPRLEAAEIQYSAARRTMLDRLTANDSTSGVTEIADGVKVAGRDPEFRGVAQLLRHALAASMYSSAVSETGDRDSEFFKQSPIVPLDSRIVAGMKLASDGMTGAPTMPVILTYRDPDTGETIQVGLTPEELTAIGLNRAVAASDAQTFEFVVKPTNDNDAEVAKFINDMRAVRDAYRALAAERGDGELSLDLEHRQGN